MGRFSMFYMCDLNAKIQKNIKHASGSVTTLESSLMIELNGNRLYIGLYSCQVYDYFYVKRCNTCQKFGHYSNKCESSSYICGYCTQDHETSSCPNHKLDNFVPTCINCKLSTDNTMKHSHESFSLTCPSYKLEQDKLRKSMLYYNSKN